MTHDYKAALDALLESRERYDATNDVMYLQMSLDEFNAIRAALQRPAVPEGYVLVPVEPTKHKPERIYVDGIFDGVGTCFEAKPSCSTTEYIRADLAIPRADVMELVRALDRIANGFLDSECGWFQDKDGEIFDVEEYAQQALANFNQKYGRPNYRKKDKSTECIVAYPIPEETQ